MTSITGEAHLCGIAVGVTLAATQNVDISKERNAMIRFYIHPTPNPTKVALSKTVQDHSAL
jgi:hypothetical protein